MPKLTRQLESHAKGALAEREDWWHLVFDTDANELYVEHSWSHTNAYRVSKGTDEGTERLPVDAYLKGGQNGAELSRLLRTMFEEKPHT